MRLTTAAIGLVMFIGSAGLAQAAVIGPGDFSGSETVIDFETVPVSTPPPGPFSIGIVTFSESSSGSGGPGWRLLSGFFNNSRTLTDNAGISNITLDFAASQQRVGLEVGIGPASFDVSFFSPSNSLLGTVGGSVTGTTESFFAGWEDLGGIAAVTIVETSGDNGFVGGLDDVRFENTSNVIPEPASVAVWSLLCVSVIGCGWWRRKRKAQ